MQRMRVSIALADAGWDDGGVPGLSPGGNPLTGRLSHYSVVRILRTGRTVALGIDGREGVIAGIAESGSHVEYAVMVAGRVCMVDSSDVEPTGEVLSRDALYDGSSVRAAPQRYPGGEGGLVARRGVMRKSWLPATETA